MIEVPSRAYIRLFDKRFTRSIESLCMHWTTHSMNRVCKFVFRYRIFGPVFNGIERGNFISRDLIIFSLFALWHTNEFEYQNCCKFFLLSTIVHVNYMFLTNFKRKWRLSIQLFLFPCKFSTQ